MVMQLEEFIKCAQIVHKLLGAKYTVYAHESFMLRFNQAMFILVKILIKIDLLVNKFNLSESATIFMCPGFLIISDYFVCEFSMLVYIKLLV